MRVLLIAPCPPAVDGIGIYALVVVRGLEAAGHDVGVVGTRSVAAGYPSEIVATLPASPCSLDDVLAAVNGFEPDVVHLQFAVAAFGQWCPSVLALARHLHRDGIPVVTTFHEVTRDTARLGAPGRWLYRTLARATDAAVVHTTEAADAVKAITGPDGPSVTLIGHHQAPPAAATVTVDELRARHRLTGHVVLLAFGFVHVDKGLDDLVAAYAEMLTRQPGWRERVQVIVAGDVRRRRGVFRLFELRDHMHLARVHRAIARCRLGDSVVFVGYVPEGEVLPWLRLADALVMPYRRIEQSGVASLAAAVGAVVLPSAVGGLVEVFAGNPWSYPPGDRHALADVLTRFVHASTADRATGTAKPGPDVAVVVDRLTAVYERARTLTGASTS